jgi:hypothetical protein
MGLGHDDSEWSRSFTIEAVCETDEEQRVINDMLHAWLMDTPSTSIPMFDNLDPDNPVAMDPVYVDEAMVTSLIIPQPFDAVRYIVRADGAVFYFE